jgi:hypothetical protein
VKRVALDLAVLLGLATIGVVYISVAQPGIRSVALHVYLLVLGALVMIALVTATSDALPRRTRGELDAALDERATGDRPLPELERMQREVTLASSSAYDLHFRLLPHLREIAAARLERRGLALAPEHLGRWWELLRPDRAPPDERFGRGISPVDLRALVEDLERI